jgi:hypothetical protein
MMHSARMWVMDPDYSSRVSTRLLDLVRFHTCIFRVPSVMRILSGQFESLMVIALPPPNNETTCFSSSAAVLLEVNCSAVSRFHWSSFLIGGLICQKDTDTLLVLLPVKILHNTSPMKDFLNLEISILCTSTV